MTPQEIKNFRELFELPETKSTSKNRLRHFVYKRTALSKIIKDNYPHMSLREISEIFFKTHSDILHYLKRHDELIDYDDYLYIYNQNLAKFNEHFKENKLMHKEEKLQIECYQWFHNKYPELRGLLNYNLNNPRNAINGQLAKLMGLQKGRPDFTFYYKGKAYFIEMKTEEGVLSKEQREMHRILRANGFEVVVIRSYDSFVFFISTLLSLTHEPGTLLTDISQHITDRLDEL